MPKHSPRLRTSGFSDVIIFKVDPNDEELMKNH